MAPKYVLALESVATIKITENAILPLRIFVNRRKLLHNNSKDSVFHTPLLSNNSIVYIKSPSTRIYLSNHDMQNLCSDIKEDLLLILYELSSPNIRDGVLKNLRIGQTLDFQKSVLNKLFTGDGEGPITSHIQTITRVAKFKIKLHFQRSWELDIFINSTKKLAEIRSFLLMKECGAIVPSLSIYARRRVLLAETSSLEVPELLQEDYGGMPEEDLSGHPALQPDEKPTLTVRYKPVLSLCDCIDIHILQRPKRKRDATV